VGQLDYIVGVCLGLRGRLVYQEPWIVQAQRCCQIVQGTEGGVLAWQDTQEKPPAAWMVAAGYHSGQAPKVALDGNVLFPYYYVQAVPGNFILLQRTEVRVVAKLRLDWLQFTPNLLYQILGVRHGLTR